MTEMQLADKIIQGDRSFDTYREYCRAQHNRQEIESLLIEEIKPGSIRKRESDREYEDHLYYLSGGQPSELSAVRNMNAEDFNIFLHRRIQEDKRKHDGTNSN